jgi:hypothetical protein
VGGKGVAERVWPDRLDDAHLFGCLPDHLTQATLVEVVATNVTGTRINR